MSLEGLFADLKNNGFSINVEDGVLYITHELEKYSLFKKISSLNSINWYSVAKTNTIRPNVANPIYKKIVFNNILIDEPKHFTWFLFNGVNTEWINCSVDHCDNNIISGIKDHYLDAKRNISLYNVPFHRGYVSKFTTLDENPLYQFMMIHMLKEVDLFIG